jgi:hypothetical protein
MNMILVAALLGLTAAPGQLIRIPIAKRNQQAFTPYAQAYAAAREDGRQVIVAVGQDYRTCRLLQKAAVKRGCHFAVATEDDGFKTGVHELIVVDDMLYFKPASAASIINASRRLSRRITRDPSKETQTAGRDDRRRE